MIVGMCALIAIILFVLTILLVENGVNKKKMYDECIGTIVRFQENTSELRLGAGETKSVSPVVSYGVNGQAYEFIGNYYSTFMKIGQTIKVFYNKKDNSKATIKTGIYFAPIVTGCLTLGCVLLTFILYIVGI